MTEDTTSGKTLQQKIDDYARLTAKKAHDICRRHNVPTEVADAMAADAVDMVHGDYQGLRATTEQMGVLSAQVQQRSWERTCNAALGFIAKYYREIHNSSNTTPLIASVDGVITCEICARRGVEVDERVAATARNRYRIYATLIIGENTDATADELLTMLPAELPDANKERLLQMALADQQTRIRLDNQAQQKRAAKKQAKPAAGTLFGGDSSSKITYFQNIAYEIGKGLLTTDDSNGKDLRPLAYSIEQQRNASTEVLNNPNATDKDKARARQYITNTNFVSQVFNGIAVIPQQLAPDSAATDRISFELTPHEYAKLCTGQEHPAQSTILGVLRATAWLGTQYTTFTEHAGKWRTEYDKDGKIVYDDQGKPRKVYVDREIKTTFQPVIAQFKTEYEDGVLAEDATRVRISINSIIANGRSGEFYEAPNATGRKERLRIKMPTTATMTLAQYYQPKSDEARRLRDIVISKEHQREDTLLAAVFDYDGRRAVFQQQAAEAQAVADAIARDTGATDEQKQAAKKSAADALYKAKYYITNHMGSDVQRLRQMLYELQQSGLLKWFAYDAHAGSAKKYGGVYKWLTTDRYERQRKQQRGRLLR